MTHHHITGRALGAAAVLVGAVLIAGCGGADDGTAEDQDVASLTSTVPGARTEAPSARPSEDDGRPQLRLDSTDAERDRYWHIYAACLKDHGHKMITARGPDSIDDTDHSPTAEAAVKACANKLPLQPPEMERATNPRFDDDYRAYVKCLNRKGLKVRALPGNTGWTYDGNSALSAAQKEKAEKSCTMEAFGAQDN